MSVLFNQRVRGILIPILLIAFLGACSDSSGRKKPLHYDKIELKSQWIRLGDHKGIKNLENPTASLRTAEFSPDMKFILSASRGGNDIVAWDTKTGQSVWEVILDKPTRVVKFSPDSKYILAGGDYNAVKIWKLSDGELVEILHHEAEVEDINFSSDGRFLVTADRSGKIFLWDASNFKMINTATHDKRVADSVSPRNDVNQVLFIDNDHHILSGGIDSWIKRWTVPQFELIDSVKTGEGSVKSIRVSPDGYFFATATAFPDNRVSLWKLSDYQRLDSKFLEFEVEAVEFAPGGNHLLVGLSENYFKYDSITDFLQIFRIDKEDRPTLSFSQGVETMQIKYFHFSADGNKLVTAHTNGILQLWNVKYK